MTAAATSSTNRPTSTVYDKYGEASIAGFQAVPDLLFRHQQDLKLSATDLVVLLNILMHWWYPDQKPFPRSTTIARRMGVATRTVQRSIREMEKSGLLERERIPHGPTYLDPQPLVERLTELAGEDPAYAHRKAIRDGEEELEQHQSLGTETSAATLSEVQF